ncbi:hypothetical protein Tcan_13656 [Toxocara canis]|uniref:Uncharacterized protein n=1 Tax=Toxocara canis TaxID=6265 RepID=A0A0B2VKJ3_TOXCA|nr:hypothetical protein Tcan_13656 [Toxocara canis]
MDNLLSLLQIATNIVNLMDVSSLSITTSIVVFVLLSASLCCHKNKPTDRADGNVSQSGIVEPSIRLCLPKKTRRSDSETSPLQSRSHRSRLRGKHLASLSSTQDSSITGRDTNENERSRYLKSGASNYGTANLTIPNIFNTENYIKRKHGLEDLDPTIFEKPVNMNCLTSNNQNQRSNSSSKTNRKSTNSMNKGESEQVDFDPSSQKRNLSPVTCTLFDRKGNSRSNKYEEHFRSESQGHFQNDRFRPNSVRSFVRDNVGDNDNYRPYSQQRKAARTTEKTTDKIKKKGDRVHTTTDKSEKKNDARNYSSANDSISRGKSHSENGRLSIEWGIEEVCGSEEGASRTAKASTSSESSEFVDKKIRQSQRAWNVERSKMHKQRAKN